MECMTFRNFLSDDIAVYFVSVPVLQKKSASNRVRLRRSPKVIPVGSNPERIKIRRLSILVIIDWSNSVFSKWLPGKDG